MSVGTDLATVQCSKAPMERSKSSADSCENAQKRGRLEPLSKSTLVVKLKMGVILIYSPFLLRV